MYSTHGRLAVYKNYAHALDGLSSNMRHAQRVCADIRIYISNGAPTHAQQVCAAVGNSYTTPSLDGSRTRRVEIGLEAVLRDRGASAGWIAAELVPVLLPLDFIEPVTRHRQKVLIGRQNRAI